MRRALVAVVLMLCTACGGAPAVAVPSEPPTSDMPTLPPLTAADRATFQAVREQIKAMTTAATNLHQLAQEIRATRIWKERVHTNVSVVTGGRTKIKAIALPAGYTPLQQRLTETTEACAHSVGALPDSIDQLAVTALMAIDTELQTCIRDLGRLDLSLSTL